MLTVIHCSARQPTVASSLDRLPYIPIHSHDNIQDLIMVEGNGNLIYEWSLYRRCRLCHQQHSLTRRKANQPLSPLRCHLLDTVTQTNRLIKCVTVTQSHTYTDIQRHENIHTHIVPNKHLAGLNDSSLQKEHSSKS